MEKTLTKTLAKSKSRVVFSRYDYVTIIMAVFGYFLGRVVIFQALNPLAGAYLVLFIGRKSRFPVISLSVLLGVYGMYADMYLLKYVLMISFMFISHIVVANNTTTNSIINGATRGVTNTTIKRGRKRHEENTKFNLLLNSRLGGKNLVVLIQCLVSTLSLLISGIICFYIYRYSSYIMFLTIIECVFIGSLTLVMNNGVNILQGNVNRKILTNEELISLSIIIASIICGSSDIYIGYISMREFFSGIVIMLIGFKGGATMGATSGVLIGFMLCVAGFGDYALIGILSLSGLFSGSCKNFKYGKITSMLGYLSGSLIVATYLAPYIVTSEYLVSIMLAGGVFICVPDEFYFDFGATMGVTQDNSKEYATRIKELSVDKLEKFAKSFYTLGKSFASSKEDNTGLTQKEITGLIDETVNEICINCEKSEYCWQEHIYDAYGFVYNMLSVCDRKGMASVHDSSDNDFINQCIYQNEFLNILNRQYTNYRSDLVWQNRLFESRDLVSQQLMGVSGIMSQLAEELNIEIQFQDTIEERLMNEFIYQKVPVHSVVVIENKLGQIEVNLAVEGCNQTNICNETIIHLVNNVLGKRMKKIEATCTGSCKLRLVEEQKFRIASGVARTTKYNSSQSGDSYSFMELKNGQYFVTLSDGMGSGSKASKESTVAIELFEEFIESGFEKELAIKMINSVLLLKNNEDFFSTLDICTIDLYSGLAEFMKIGAASTFIIRNNTVQVIKSSSLPMGILNTVDLEVCCKKIKENDLIVMVSDGIIESKEDMESKENWIVNFLEKMPYKNPQDIADSILEVAKKESQGIAKDDMTVLVCKIWNKN